MSSTLTRAPIGRLIHALWCGLTKSYPKGIFLLCVFLAKPSIAAIDYLNQSAFQSSGAAQGLLLDIIDTGERLIAVGERGHVLYSEDQGESWQQANVPVYVTLTAVHFATPQKGWAVGHEGVILHSMDGGLSWHKQLDGFAINEQVLQQVQARLQRAQQAVEAAATDDQREEAGFELEEAGYAISDAEEDAKAGPTKPLLDVWFKNEQEGFAVGSYGLLLRTGNAGASWELWSDRLDNSDGYHLNAITVTASGTLVLVGEAGAIHRSVDGGNHWQAVSSPSDGSLFGAIAKGNDVYSFGLRGRLFRSSDQGSVWHSIQLPEPVSINGGVVTRDGRIILVGGAGVVIYSDDGGNQFSISSRQDRLPNSAIVEASNGSLIAVGFRGVKTIDNHSAVGTSPANPPSQ